ncbi:MAG: hypothetical protein KA006_02005, partial [Neisseria sp.]|nr:hypothetical protein [Neisseria sp.]
VKHARHFALRHAAQVFDAGHFAQIAFHFNLSYRLLCILSLCAVVYFYNKCLMPSYSFQTALIFIFKQKTKLYKFIPSLPIMQTLLRQYRQGFECI